MVDEYIKIKSLIENVVKEANANWRVTLVNGEIMRRTNRYYVVVYEGNYIANSSLMDAFLSQHCIKLNAKKGFITPEPDTINGDLKIQDRKIYHFYKYSNRKDFWNNPG